ncbi:MAG: hypothetical protein ACKORA_05815 [Solirubrobacterales bacterium]
MTPPDPTPGSGGTPVPRPEEEPVTPVPGDDAVARPVSGVDPPRSGRSAAEIRADMDARRRQLSNSVDTLRTKVFEVTDWRGQIRRHRREIVTAAVVTGFVVGGLLALRRR